jgi:hypothetical protein
MKVSPFEMDAMPRGERQEEPPGEAAPKAAAAPAEKEDTQRREDPTEEPGYGHGV